MPDYKNLEFERGLPVAVDAERVLLGAIMTDGAAFTIAAAIVDAVDFSLEKHRRIFQRMADLHGRGEIIDHITVADELSKTGQLESCDGLTYLVSLGEALPKIFSPDAYANIVKEKARLRQIIFASQRAMDQAMAGGEASADIAAGMVQSFVELHQSSTNGTQDPMGVTSIIENYPGGVQAFWDPLKRPRGLQTGFIKFDDMTGGLYPGQLIIVAARPSVGKSSYAGNVACHIALRGDHKDHVKKTVVIFSLEMSKDSLLQRFVCAEARVDQHKFRLGYVNKDERQRIMQATHELSETNLLIDDTTGLTLMAMHSKLLKIKAEMGLHLAIIDYLQLMDVKERTENRTREIGILSKGLKMLAGELKVPVMALSQLSRAPETRTGDHRPILSDLREGGSIEQEADVVAFLFREELYKPDWEHLHGMAELILRKQRNGPIGTIKLAFLKEFTKFENLAMDVGDEVDAAVTGQQHFKHWSETGGDH